MRIDQLTLYADAFAKQGVKEIYLYLISPINEDSFVILKNRGVTKVFSANGAILQGMLADLQCSIHIIEPSALVADARASAAFFLN